MRPEEFEKLFRETSDQAHFDFDDSQWSEVQASLFPKKKRRFSPFWFLLLVLPVGLVVAGHIEFDSNDDVSIMQNPSGLSNNDISQTKETSEINQEISSTSDNFEIPSNQNIASSKATTTNKISKPSTSIINENKISVDQENSATETATLEVAIASPIQQRNLIEIAQIGQATFTNLNLVIPLAQIDARPQKSFHKKWGMAVEGQMAAQKFYSNTHLSNGIGLRIERYFSCGWQFSATPTLLVHHSNTSASKVDYTQIFGTESKDVYYQITPRTMASIAIPIALGVNLNRLSAEFGYHAELLLAASGEIVLSEYEDGRYQVSDEPLSGQLDKRHSVDLIHGFYGGVAYQLTPRQGLGIYAKTYNDVYMARDNYETNINKPWAVGISYKFYIR